MGTVYLEVYQKVDGDTRSVPVESFVVLYTLRSLALENDSEFVRIQFVETVQEAGKPSLPVDTSSFKYDVIEAADKDMPCAAKMCTLPVFVGESSYLKTIVAGLSAVLRNVLRTCSEEHPLLGFRQTCLIACAEVSVWTKFCEVDVIQAVKSVLLNPEGHVQSVPVDVARLEEHLAHAPRLHNARKHRQNYAKEIGSLQSEEELPHSYAEGPYMTLADIILLPCFHIVLHSFSTAVVLQYLPLVHDWMARVRASEEASRALDMLDVVSAVLSCTPIATGQDVPVVPKESLYKSDPGRYKPRSNKMYTNQEDVESSLSVVSLLKEKHTLDQSSRPWGEDISLDWESLPIDVRPEGGYLPEARQSRKAHQLKNMARAVLKIAQPGHTIVDFCCGSGHLGLLLAVLLPSCKILLLENKHKSLHRAASRIECMELTNVHLVQSNVDYFQGNFDVGIALHACGVATDLVLQLCESKRAAFVTCPCCYGSIQDGHTVTYPRSNLYQNSTLTYKDYLVLGHCADQTHGEEGIKTNQGNLCMAAIDVDRLLHAQEQNYTVFLSKMFPQTCSPKNNLLVGLPNENVDFLQFQYLSMTS